MIVAAGLGTRLRPLTELRPKPALPVRGLPLVAYPLALLARHGVSEIVINVHRLPEVLIEAAQRYRPQGVSLRFSREDTLLDTGGGIRRVADFLRESDPCLILGSDMLIDCDLSALVRDHAARGDAVTFLLLQGDPRAEAFGTVGVDEDGRVRRIGSRFHFGEEVAAGIYPWVNVVSARAFESLPDREVFGHFDDWIAPLLAAGAGDIRGELARGDGCVWQPVGTPREYLEANLEPVPLSFLDADALARSEGTRFEGELVLGAGASLGEGAELKRAVVWDGERVPPGLHASDGVFAGGAFHPSEPPAPRASAQTQRRGEAR